jgi:hypothetical protein
MVFLAKKKPISGFFEKREQPNGINAHRLWKMVLGFEF